MYVVTTALIDPRGKSSRADQRATGFVYAHHGRDTLLVGKLHLFFRIHFPNIMHFAAALSRWSGLMLMRLIHPSLTKPGLEGSHPRDTLVFLVELQLDSLTSPLRMLLLDLNCTSANVLRVFAPISTTVSVTRPNLTHSTR
jgi:hypothetical protein